MSRQSKTIIGGAVIAGLLALAVFVQDFYPAYGKTANVVRNKVPKANDDLVAQVDAITVWSTPPPGGSGSSGSCPGSYVGYVNFSKTSPPYGWTPIAGQALYRACDGTDERCDRNVPHVSPLDGRKRPRSAAVPASSSHQ